MIAVMLAAAIAPAFAPPPGTITYTIRDLYAAHEAVTTRETLAFTRDDRGLVAHLVPLSRTSDASPQARDAIARLFAPLIGVESKLRLAADGTPLQLIDSDRPWAAFLASRAALRAKFNADPALPAAAKAMTNKVLDAETAPTARDQRLREPFEQILPPRLPPLAIGSSSDFKATIATPGGPVSATGKVTLTAIENDLLRYRITLATAPIGDKAAVYKQSDDLTIDRATGLLAAAHRERSLVIGGGAVQPILTEDIAR
ncbi:hypothetical protein FHS31_001449 [Sphingomonas vulcanisoli]|uniref:DUF2066 domain-containing protein n=1 Tax=Sphingomonas vulcanisoli TaxID=1658060 RepID=A0ABX0TQN0_9SPHN|nr:hypothetical protein [Sphingomonas vulcanisoli]NIJ07839.1 hypothetical protein [Sphingomonas vulcanisoli]